MYVDVLCTYIHIYSYMHEISKVYKQIKWHVKPKRHGHSQQTNTREVKHQLFKTRAHWHIYGHIYIYIWHMYMHRNIDVYILFAYINVCLCLFSLSIYIYIRTYIHMHIHNNIDAAFDTSLAFMRLCYSSNYQGHWMPRRLQTWTPGEDPQHGSVAALCLSV